MAGQGRGVPGEGSRRTLAPMPTLAETLALLSAARDAVARTVADAPALPAGTLRGVTLHVLDVPFTFGSVLVACDDQGRVGAWMPSVIAGWTRPAPGDELRIDYAVVNPDKTALVTIGGTERRVPRIERVRLANGARL